jgi:hypothetical protein
MQKIIFASLLAAGLISGAAIAADVPTTETTVPGFVVGETVRTEATVVAVNLKDRIVTLKNAEGNVLDVVVGDKVKNLAQVKIGDVVVAEHSFAVAAKLKKGSGLRSTTENTDAARAAPGEKPAGIVAREIDFVADVLNVDAKTGIVTLQGAKGKIVDLKVNDPKVLAEIKKGDQVEGSYIEAMAIAVVPAKSKK